jgi:plastocyanin
MNPPARTLLIVPVVALLSVVGCADTDADTSVAVGGTDDSCELASDQLAAGNIGFDFTNDGDKVSELYVLRENDDIVGEVENVGPGISRTLTVDLVAGDYQVRCKPGQAGEGITQPFTVTGEGGTAQGEADRTITFDSVDFSYEDLDLTGIAPGDTIRFEMTNTGSQPHEFEVLDPEGEAIGEVAAVDVGESGGATITFDTEETYDFQCILEDPETGELHTMLGMSGTFEVGATG